MKPPSRVQKVTLTRYESQGLDDAVVAAGEIEERAFIDQNHDSESIESQDKMGICWE